MNKKIAIFHNALDAIGGAEIVCLTLAQTLNADIYTTNIDYHKIKILGFQHLNIKSIGRVPRQAPFRQQLISYKFRRLNLHNLYNHYIIGGDWAVSAAVNSHPNIWYVHSPIREIWDLYQYTRHYTVPWYKRYLFDGWVFFNRHLNRRYMQYVDNVVCNSLNTQGRVHKYLQCNAKIIYPPVNIPELSVNKTRKNNLKMPFKSYWLSVNRLVRHKRIEMQLEAFRRLPQEKLIIVGSYESARHFKSYANWIKKIKPDNVEILHWVDNDSLMNLYKNCKGFITTSLDEDFGMSAVEAMAYGKPVIAPNEGGYKESVVNGVTGKLINDINSEKLMSAIKEMVFKTQDYYNDCVERAVKFSTERFIREIKELL